ncbi:MAG TPA: type II secretion system F family protein, partial [Thermodesulfobacteriota bacterium]|nr:type II secretion system F family protein [Thermodesulfobacteriota bacterium]
MPVYSYKATNNTGEVVEGSLDAAEEQVVVEKLHDLGLIPIRIHLPQEARSSSFNVSLEALWDRISFRDVLVFTHEMDTLVSAGLPLDRSLQIAVQLTENKKLRAVIESVLRSVEEGHSLADALGRHPKVFSRLYTNMIRAGEAGGVIELILKRLAEYLESMRETRDYVVSALIYPIILIIAGALMVVFMLVWVVPRFAVMFEGSGQVLPLPTRILLGVSNGIVSYWWLIAPLIAAAIFGVKRFVATEDGRSKWDHFKFRFKLMRRFIQKSEVARFSRTLGTLIRSGVPILEAFTIVKETMANTVFIQAIAEVRTKMKEGESIAKPLGQSGVFPALAIHMITVGEETGRLDEMLLQVADNYDKEVKNSVRRMIALLEPLL